MTYTPLSAYKESIQEELSSSEGILPRNETSDGSPGVSYVTNSFRYRFKASRNRYTGVCSVVTSDSFRSPQAPVSETWWQIKSYRSVLPIRFRYLAGDDVVAFPASQCSAILDQRSKGRRELPSFETLVKRELRRMALYYERQKLLFERWSSKPRFIPNRKGVGRVGTIKYKERKAFVPRPYIPKWVDFFQGKTVTPCYLSRGDLGIVPKVVSHRQTKGVPVSKFHLTWSHSQHARIMVPGQLKSGLEIDSYIRLNDMPTVEPDLLDKSFFMNSAEYSDHQIPVFPEKEGYIFQVDPVKVSMALESLFRDLNPRDLDLPVASVEYIRDTPDFLRFATNVYRAVRAVAYLPVKGGGRLAKAGLAILGLHHGTKTIRAMSRGLLQDFLEAARVCSGADLERKFSVSDVVRDALALWKSQVFKEGGNLDRFLDVLKKRGVIQVQHRVIDRTSHMETKVVTLSDLLHPVTVGGVNYRAPMFPPLVAEEKGHPSGSPSGEAARSLSHICAFLDETVGSMVTSTETVDRLTVCSAWDFYDALGNRVIDDVVANGLGVQSLGLTLSTQTLWDLVPITFIIDWFYNIGEQHRYFYSLKPMSPTTQYYWAMVSRSEVRNVRWMPRNFMGTRADASYDMTQVCKFTSEPTSFQSRNYKRMHIDPQDYTNLGRDWRWKLPRWWQSLTGLEILFR